MVSSDNVAPSNFGDDVLMTQSQMGRMTMSQSQSSSGLKSRLFNALGIQSNSTDQSGSGQL